MVKILGGGGGSCLAHQRRSRKKRPGSEDKVPDTKSRGGKKAEELLLLYRKMELPAAGEHVFAVESIEKKRSRKVCHKSIEGHFYAHAETHHFALFFFPSPSIRFGFSLNNF